MAVNHSVFDPILHWPEWTDVLGNKYSAGDYVAYASISGKSPQLVIARVERINRLNSNREEIVTVTGRYPNQTRVPYCSLTVTPVIDARGFYRTRTKYDPLLKQSVPIKVKPVTLHIVENAIKIDWTPPDDHNAP